jgi:hypothetical protein
VDLIHCPQATSSSNGREALSRANIPPDGETYEVLSAHYGALPRMLSVDACEPVFVS